jgi:hypothetical protein
VLVAFAGLILPIQSDAHRRDRLPAE